MGNLATEVQIALANFLGARKPSPRSAVMYVRK